MAVVGRAEMELVLENRRALAGLRDTEQAVERTFGGRIGNTIKGFTDRIDKAESSLTKFGVSSRDVAVILGAGLAGGIAFAIRSMIDFVAQAVKAASDLQEATSKASVVFGSATESVLEFAEGADKAFGLSKRAVLEATATFGNFFTNLGFGKAAAAELSIGMAQLAADIASFNNVPIEQALTAMRAGLVGETEPLRRLGVNLSAARIQQEGFTLGLIDAGEKLNAAGKAIVTYAIVVQDAETAYGDMARTGDHLATSTKQLQAAFENAKAELGESLLPLAVEGTQALTEAANAFERFFDNPLQETGEEMIGLAKAAGEFFGVLEDPNLIELGEAMKFAKEEGISLDEALVQMESNLAKDERFNQYTQTVERLAVVAGLSADQTEKLKEIILDEADAAFKAGKENLNLNDAFKKFQETLPPTQNLLDQIVDAHVRLGRAIEDAAAAEDEASIRLQRAREDALKKALDAERDLSRAVEDGAKKREDARRKLFRAEREAAESVLDAQQRLGDTQLQNFRSIRDAEEALSDARIDSAKKVEDAEEALFEARREHFNDLLSAQISLEEALFRGDVFAERSARLALLRVKQDEQTEKAKEKLADAREERELRLFRLQRDLDEARFDADKAIKRAKEELARAIIEADEKIADAERALQDVIVQTAQKEEDAKRRLGEVEIEINRALFDAQEGLTKAVKQGERAVDDATVAVNRLFKEFQKTGGSANDLWHILGEVNKRVQDIPDTPFTEMLNELNEMAEAAARLERRLDRIFAKHFLENPGNTMNNPDGTFDFKASGGQFSAFRPRVVGEKGIELEIPHYPGAIVSNADVIKALQSIAGGDGSSAGGNTIIVNESIDGQATAAAVINRMVLEGLA